MESIETSPIRCSKAEVGATNSPINNSAFRAREKRGEGDSHDEEESSAENRAE